jgi:hypothetical protein
MAGVSIQDLAMAAYVEWPCRSWAAAWLRAKRLHSQRHVGR